MNEIKQHPIRIAEKLRAIRASLGLSQNQLVKILGFHGELIQSHISAYEVEKHNRTPPVGVLLQYARVARIPLETIVDDNLDLPEIVLHPSSKSF